MSQTSIAEIAPALPAEVVAYATKQGLEACLRPLLEMTQALFGSPCGLELFLEDDPEIADLKFIVFQLAGPARDAARIHEARERWIRASLKCSPPPCAFPFAPAVQLSQQ